MAASLGFEPTQTLEREVRNMEEALRRPFIVVNPDETFHATSSSSFTNINGNSSTLTFKRKKQQQQQQQETIELQSGEFQNPIYSGPIEATLPTPIEEEPVKEILKPKLKTHSRSENETDGKSKAFIDVTATPLYKNAEESSDFTQL